MSDRVYRIALQRMVRRISQAAHGTGDALEVLLRFGLDAKELIKLDASRQFEFVCQCLNTIINPIEKLAAAVALFDREGFEIALANGGKD